MSNDGINQEPENSEDLDISLEEALAFDVSELLRSSDFDQALETIDSFYAANVYRDTNDQISNQCNLLKAQVFEEQGRQQEALSLYHLLSQNTEPSDQLFVYRKLDLVRVLRKVGSVEEAILEIEKTLEQQTNNAILGLLNLLAFYVDILESRDEVIPVKYQPLLRDLVDRIGVEDLSDDISEDSRFMNIVVNELSQKNRDANKRYSHLLFELDEVEDDSQADSLLRSYISQEKVGYYRNLAVEELNELET